MTYCKGTVFKFSSLVVRAALRGHLSTVKTLLAFGENAGFRNLEDIIALDVAPKMGHVDVMREFVHYQVSIIMSRGPSSACLSQHEAARANQASAVDMFEAGIDVDVGSKEYWIPLHAAVISGSYDAAVALPRSHRAEISRNI